MKTRINDLFLLPALIAGLGLIPPGRVTAQTFTTLYSFTATPPYPGPYINSDGAAPHAGLILSGNTMYGTAAGGGSSGYGTIFALNIDGTGFTNLHGFNSWSDGAIPQAGLIFSGSTLYGTTMNGGTSDNGAVFAVNADGTGFTNLHSFTANTHNTNSDGASPRAGLLLSSKTLYGTARNGGSSGNGTVFAIHTDGTGFTNLHSFTGGSDDGASPRAGLVLSSNTLYGTASLGGNSGKGTVFALNTDGTGFTNLHSFPALNNSTNRDGAGPWAGLVLSGNTLYGTATGGGRFGYGTVFAVNTDGMGFTNLHSFTATSGPFPPTNSDGAIPWAGLILSGNTLYGTANGGGSAGKGTVFALNTDGTSFTNLHSFTPFNKHDNSDTGYPMAGLILSGNTLYGTTHHDGSSSNGTIFSLSFAPRLTLTRSGTNGLLTWPTNVAGFDYTGFTLQSTTNLVSPAVWTPVVPGPVVVNGQNAVTNPISGTQQFYRLSQ